MSKKPNKPIGKTLGVIMLDTRFPRPIGDIGNPETFEMPVMYETVFGATPERVVIEQDPALLQPYIDAGRELVMRGADFVTTSCGFLAPFQDEIEASLTVPVLTSSLHMVPDLERKFGEGRVGILTISEEGLTRPFLAALGISAAAPVECPPKNGAFCGAILENRAVLDESASEIEVVAAAQRLIKKHPEVREIVLECTNMPPYSLAIESATGRPVHSLVSRLNALLA